MEEKFKICVGNRGSYQMEWHGMKFILKRITKNTFSCCIRNLNRDGKVYEKGTFIYHFHPKGKMEKNRVGVSEYMIESLSKISSTEKNANAILSSGKPLIRRGRHLYIQVEDGTIYHGRVIPANCNGKKLASVLYITSQLN